MITFTRDIESKISSFYSSGAAPGLDVVVWVTSAPVQCGSATQRRGSRGTPGMSLTTRSTTSLPSCLRLVSVKDSHLTSIRLTLPQQTTHPLKNISFLSCLFIFFLYYLFLNHGFIHFFPHDHILFKKNNVCCV